VAQEDRERLTRALRRVSPEQGRFHASLRLVVRVACRLFGWRIETSGLERLPGGVRGRPGAGCLVVVVPHRAWVDPFLVAAAWPPGAARPVWVGEGRTMVRSWWRRRLLPGIGLIPTGAGWGGPRAYVRLATEALARGVAVVVFPERGAPSPPHRTREVSPGFAYLALASGAPVVPVVLGGTHRIVRGVAFTVDVLEPIPVRRAATDEAIDADPFAPERRAEAARLLDAFDAAVARVLPERVALADRRRPRRERWPWLGGLFR
jgi:1-acyl-sn-glycerol-3-phosphate acyltransferase